MFLRLSKRCLRAELESNNVLHEKSNEDEGRTSHAVAEHGRSFTSKSTKNELDGDATERKLMEATRRDKILESNRVQQNAMFPTNLNDDCEVSTAEQKQENQRGVPLQYAEKCAAQFSKFDVLEERLGGLNTNTSLRVPIIIAPKKNETKIRTKTIRKKAVVKKIENAIFLSITWMLTWITFPKFSRLYSNRYWF